MNDGNGELQWVVSAYIISLGAITTRDQLTVGTEKVAKIPLDQKGDRDPLKWGFLVWVCSRCECSVYTRIHVA
jgi:hypothetical protein